MTIGWTVAKMDSWDNEYLYVKAEGSTIWSKKVRRPVGRSVGRRWVMPAVLALCLN